MIFIESKSEKICVQNLQQNEKSIKFEYLHIYTDIGTMRTRPKYQLNVADKIDIEVMISIMVGPIRKIVCSNRSVMVEPLRSRAEIASPVFRAKCQRNERF